MRREGSNLRPSGGSTSIITVPAAIPKYANCFSNSALSSIYEGGNTEGMRKGATELATAGVQVAVLVGREGRYRFKK